MTVKDKIKVVGLLPGWPFPVREEPAMVALGGKE
jgi:hypothetical protein